MGCNHSKVSSSAEEIVAKKREVKFGVTCGMKNRLSKGKAKFKSRGQERFQRMISPSSISDGEDSPLYWRSDDDLEVQSICSDDFSVTNFTVDVPTPRASPEIQGKATEGMTTSPNPQLRPPIVDDLILADMEDEASLTSCSTSVSLHTDQLNNNNGCFRQTFGYSSSPTLREDEIGLGEASESLTPHSSEGDIHNPQYRPLLTISDDMSDLTDTMDIHLVIPGTPQPNTTRVYA